MWLVTPITSMPLLYHIMVYNARLVITIAHRVHRCVRLLMSFILLQCAQHFLALRNLANRDKASRSISLISPCSMTQVCVVLRKQCLTTNFWRITKGKENSLCWEVEPMESHWPIASWQQLFICQPVVSSMALSSPLWGNSI